MDEEAFRDRLRGCRAGIDDDDADADADAVVLFPSPNLYYLTGFWEEPSERHLLFFVTAEDHLAVVPELYREQFLAETWLEPDDLVVWADDEDPLVALRSAVEDLGIDRGRVLVDDRMFATFVQDLRAVAPGIEVGMASEVTNELRVRKDEAELSTLRDVAALTDEVSEAVRAMGAEAVGLTEAELAAEIRDRLEAAGGTGVSFETIVGSGPNGARPHHVHGDRRIERGDPVVLDFGTRLDHYPSDQTRTVVFAGDPPAEFERVHDVVREAQQAGVEAVEPGVEAGAVDRAAREVIEAAGYGDQFVHRTGHGVGLDVHEAPFVVGGSDTELEPGMVFSVEPGVYLEGEFGVRIEDLVVVTGDGAERLNDSDRGWRPP
jgi:Xaa-Pro aminopeptidase